MLFPSENSILLLLNPHAYLSIPRPFIVIPVCWHGIAQIIYAAWIATRDFKFARYYCSRTKPSMLNKTMELNKSSISPGTPCGHCSGSSAGKPNVFRTSTDARKAAIALRTSKRRIVNTISVLSMQSGIYPIPLWRSPGSRGSVWLRWCRANRTDPLRLPEWPDWAGGALLWVRFGRYAPPDQRLEAVVSLRLFRKHVCELVLD